MGPLWGAAQAESSLGLTLDWLSGVEWGWPSFLVEQGLFRRRVHLLGEEGDQVKGGKAGAG